ncbi:MAG: type III-B CRISPR module RAMP protein Cmr4 [Ruminococcus sp.]|nr:type III-B CRISPR module RAMP protein Cmr4 [Ruminococcus sp.]
MSVFVYKARCLTNLHVGSGDVNYNIVDNEVEKDAVTGYPMVHSSGFKGALREHFVKSGMSSERIKEIFGNEPGKAEIVPGSYKFLDMDLIARPMRVIGAGIASVPVVSVDSVNGFLEKLNDFGCNPFGIARISPIDFGDKQFLTNIKSDGIRVEGDTTGKLPEASAKELEKLSGVIGEKFAVVKDFNDYDLPVIARNYLDDGVSKNLWYEEVVPHGSVFCAVIITPDDKMELNLSDYIQIGGHASIGCGFMKFERL